MSDLNPSITRNTQLVVIGAGPGGYAAAFAAADRGISTILVDADPQPGGVCLNRGCIPSKALLHIARIISETREAAEWGIAFGEPKIDIDAVRRWKESIISKNAAGIRQLAKSRRVEIVRAWARFENSQTLLLSSQQGGPADLGRLTFEHAIIATGSRPTIPPALRVDSPRIMDSTSALELPEIPKRLLIVGGGYIGLEMGTFYSALGSEVSVVEMTDGLLPGADRDLVRVLQNRLKKSFKQIMVSTRVIGLRDTGNEVEVMLEPAQTAASTTGSTVAESISTTASPQTFDRVLIAVGRTPNSDGLGLENTAVQIASPHAISSTSPRGFIETNEKCQTADPHIYAIGDVAGEPMLAHKASKQAKVAAAVIVGDKNKATFDVRAIPGVVFTDPEVAWTGITEDLAKTKGIDVTLGKFPWGASGRATAMGRNDGLTKVIAEAQTQRIIGVGIVGVGAGELIAEATLAIEMGATAKNVGLTIHAHPTLAETLGEAAELVHGTATHIFRPPR